MKEDKESVTKYDSPNSAHWVDDFMRSNMMNFRRLMFACPVVVMVLIIREMRSFKRLCSVEDIQKSDVASFRTIFGVVSKVSLEQVRSEVESIRCKTDSSQSTTDPRGSEMELVFYVRHFPTLRTILWFHRKEVPLDECIRVSLSDVELPNEPAQRVLQSDMLAHLRTSVLNRGVSVRFIDIDKENDVVRSIVSLGYWFRRIDIGRSLISEGFATHRISTPPNARFLKRRARLLARTEKRARRLQVGLWKKTNRHKPWIFTSTLWRWLKRWR
eukprot:256361_1